MIAPSPARSLGADLSDAELAVVLAAAGRQGLVLRPPSALAPLLTAGLPPDRVSAEALVAALKTRVILDDDGRLSDWLATALALVVADVPSLHVVATVADRVRHSWFAVGPALGAAVGRDENRGAAATLVLFDPLELDAQLSACLPVLGERSSDPRTAVYEADPRALVAAVAALVAGQERAAELVAGVAGWEGPGESDTVRSLSVPASALLQVTALLPSARLLDTLTWYAADDGWWQIDIDAARTGDGPALSVVPRAPEDLAGAVAPLIGAMLVEQELRGRRA